MLGTKKGLNHISDSAQMLTLGVGAKLVVDWQDCRTYYWPLNHTYTLSLVGRLLLILLLFLLL